LVPQFESDSSTIINDVIVVIICLNISQMRCCKNEKRLEVHDVVHDGVHDGVHDEVHDVFAIVVVMVATCQSAATKA